MPTYEYQCRDCGETLEKVQAFTDPPLETCPNCGGSLRKVFGNVGIVFKGSGFYKTDSRQGSSKSSIDAKSTPASSTTKEASGSSAPSSSSDATSSTASSAKEKSAAPASATSSSGD